MDILHQIWTNSYTEKDCQDVNKPETLRLRLCYYITFAMPLSKGTKRTFFRKYICLIELPIVDHLRKFTKNCISFTHINC